VLADLMDESPTKVGETELEELPHRVRSAAEAMPWVAQAAVRLREQGHVISGDVFVVPRTEHDIVSNVKAAAENLLRLDWRLYSLTITPVANLDSVEPPAIGENIS
jgi:hypothetical protein